MAAVLNSSTTAPAHEQDGSRRGVGRQVPGGDRHEDDRKPQADHERPCHQHVAFVHGLNPYDSGQTRFPPSGRLFADAGEAQRLFSVRQICFLQGKGTHATICQEKPDPQCTKRYRLSRQVKKVSSQLIDEIFGASVAPTIGEETNPCVASLDCFLKDPKLEPQLGAMLTDMLITMTDRGPDSAGIAIYSGAKDGLGKTDRAIRPARGRLQEP